MRVYRGRGDTVEADRAASDRVVESVRREQDPALRVWRPPRHLAFGRRDSAADGYERAREIGDERGFPPVEREVGGRAVAYTGSTLAFARVTTVADERAGISERYERALSDLRTALADLGVNATAGEPPNSFCPGSHSLQATVAGRQCKLGGLAQRVRQDVAVVAGVLVVADHEDVAAVLGPVYEALGVVFDPSTVGSVALADGDTDTDTVVEAVTDALVGDAAVTIEGVETLTDCG